MPDTPLLHFRREKEEPQGNILARLCFNPHDVWRGCTGSLSSARSASGNTSMCG